MEIPLALIESYYDELGPETLLNVVEEDSHCHMKGHNIGKIIYRKTRDLENAMLVCSDGCTYGCAHGVLSEFFEEQATEKNLSIEHPDEDQIRILIKDVCDEASSNLKNGKKVCAHGLGHGLLALPPEDLNTAISRCGYFQEERLQFYCASGVYMEYFFSNQNIAQKSSHHPCDDFEFSDACYRYKIGDSFGPNQYQEAINFCNQILDEKQKANCFGGIGFTFARKVENKEISLEELCIGDQESQKACIENAVEIVATYNKASDVCDAVSGEQKDWCLNTKFNVLKNLGNS